jgi:polysaccharide biosynthesis protein PslH
MSYPPNEEAVLYFASQILPIIRNKIPEIKFYIVGRNPGAPIKRLASDLIFVTGEVVNVQDYLSKSDVVVVPILTGAGMRIKILEAFAMGKAVVSTSVGAEGIAYTNNLDIVIGDTPADFAEKVCLLLENREMSDTLGSNARKLVEKEYDAGIVWQKWRAVYEHLIL